MRLTRYGHACVRLDLDGGSVVLDPGTFSPDVDLDGVGDILVSHEHPDHIDVDRVRPVVAAGARLHTHPELAAVLRSEHGIVAEAVAVGWSFEVPGAKVHVVGGEHAEVYGGLPGCANVGFVVGGVYHPGDSWHVPEQEVETLLLPVAGPWVKLAESIDFLKAVAPRRAVPIHDVMLSDIGVDHVDRWCGGQSGEEYVRLAPGESVLL